MFTSRTGTGRRTRDGEHPILKYRNVYSHTMNETFRQHVEQLHGKFETLIQMSPVKISSLPKDLPPSGIYLFSEGSHHLYIGRSRKIRQRLSLHVGGPAGASFAFKLARETCGRQKPTYVKEGSRTHLMTLPEFSSAFDSARTRIRKMDIRFVAEADTNRQALLEIYATLALGTPYNDFDTH